MRVSIFRRRDVDWGEGYVQVEASMPLASAAFTLPLKNSRTQYFLPVPQWIGIMFKLGWARAEIEEA